MKLDAFRYDGGRNGKKTPTVIPVIEIIRKTSSGWDIEVAGGIIIHVWHKLPSMTYKDENIQWFNMPLYSFN